MSVVRRLPRLPLRLVVVAAVAIGVAAGGWLWVRDSSLVRVRQVSIVGAGSSDEARIRSALREAAAGMTTLHVREEALRTAVTPFPSVAGVEVDADPPHELVIEVIEHQPAALLRVRGSRIPASGGGRLLRGLRTGRLPEVTVDREPVGPRVTDRRVLSALAVAAAAPPELRGRAAAVRLGPRGVTVELRAGPELVFGNRKRAAAKWAAAARVLAEPSAAGATYLDLRVPERVAAGGVGPVDPEEEAASVPAPTAVPTAEPTALPEKPQP
jgi:cell division protein FtsQ